MIDSTRQGLSRRLLLASGVSLAASLGVSDGGFSMETKDGGYAEVDGLRVYYERHGAVGGAPIVLLAGGAMAIDTALAADLIPRFSKTRSVIAVEPQGHGHTGDRPGPIRLSPFAHHLVGVDIGRPLVSTHVRWPTRSEARRGLDRLSG